MPNKRMINGEVWEDDFFNQLDIFQRLMWIGIITACADDQGRFQYNLALIRSKVFPMDDIPLSDIDKALSSYLNSGRVAIYERNEKKCVQIVNWWKHQKSQWAGKSSLPAPMGWVDRERYQIKDRVIITRNWTQQGGYIDDYIDDYIDGDLDSLPDHNVKDNVKDNNNYKDKSGAAAVFCAYEENIGILTSAITNKIEQDLIDYPEDWIIEAIEISARNEKRSLSYVDAILKRWKQEGKTNGTKPKPVQQEPSNYYRMSEAVE